MTIPKETITAAHILRGGGLVAFPTETVYGLGADASNPAAVAKIYQAKKRPLHHPLIVHIADQSCLPLWASHVPEAAWQLAQAFWPGPLTIVLKKQPAVSGLVTGGQETIGLRAPRHSVAQDLLQTFGGGIAAPSANQFTHISPTDAQAVKEELGDTIDYLLEGGNCEVGLESTIIDLSGRAPTLLRAGMISLAAIEGLLGIAVRQEAAFSAVRAPGMHTLHYAPATPTKLLSFAEIEQMLVDLVQSKEQVPTTVLLRSRTKDTLLQNSHIQNIHIIAMPENALQYAQVLYRSLRAADKTHGHAILIENVPDTLEWAAILDRLTKASGKRP